MAVKSLAVKYRPKTFDDVTEQGSIKVILENQIKTQTIKNAYLFCGGAGTGKTTCARIFANVINNGIGDPIELDAASNNSVDDIRRLTEQAQKKSIDSEYKVFIIDECHSLSNQAWQASLKILEEPPAKSIFIFCTTNPEKIPATILSRVQRYNFQRISQEGIVNRLAYILESEQREMFNDNPKEWENFYYNMGSLEYIAKIADGGMRDAITLMDKCLSYSKELTLENVVKALGVVDYSQMIELTDDLLNKNSQGVIEKISKVYMSGLDLKLFIKNYFEFILDVSVYFVTKDLSTIKIPGIYENVLKAYNESKIISVDLLKLLADLQSSIKWEQNPKAIILAKFMLFMEEI